MVFYVSADNGCGKECCGKAFASSSSPTGPARRDHGASLHPVGRQMLPKFPPLVLPFPLLCITPLYFPFYLYFHLFSILFSI